MKQNTTSTGQAPTPVRLGAILVAIIIGALCVAEVAATQGTSWMTVSVAARYGHDLGPRLTEVSGWALTGALIALTFLARWLSVRKVNLAFGVMALAFAVLGWLPHPAWLAFVLLFTVGALGFQRPFLRAAAPRRTGLPKGLANGIISGVSVFVTPIAFYLVAQFGKSLGAAGGYRALCFLMAACLAGAMFVFRNYTPEQTANTPRAATPRAWTRRTVIGALLNGLNVAAIGPHLFPLGEVLAQHDFGNALWVLAVNATAMPAGLLIGTVWSRRIDRYRDYGSRAAEVVTLVGAVVLFLGQGLSGAAWITVQFFGFLALYLGVNMFEPSLNALLGRTGGKATVLNAGRTGLWTASGFVGNLVVFNTIRWLGVPVTNAEVSLAFALVAAIAILLLTPPRLDLQNRGHAATPNRAARLLHELTSLVRTWWQQTCAAVTEHCTTWWAEHRPRLIGGWWHLLLMTLAGADKPTRRCIADLEEFGVDYVLAHYQTSAAALTDTTWAEHGVVMVTPNVFDDERYPASGLLLFTRWVDPDRAPYQVFGWAQMRKALDRAAQFLLRRRSRRFTMSRLARQRLSFLDQPALLRYRRWRNALRAVPVTSLLPRPELAPDELVGHLDLGDIAVAVVTAPEGLRAEVGPTLADGIPWWEHAVRHARSQQTVYAEVTRALAQSRLEDE